MRNKKITVFICMGLLLVTVGCSKSNADVDAPTVGIINFNDVIDLNAEENSSGYQNKKENADNQSYSQNSNGEAANNQFDNSLQNDDNQQNNNQDLTQLQADYVQSQSDSSQSQSENEQSQSDSELDGNIESIGDNSVVINKTFHPSANEAVSYAGSEKVLVTVYFSKAYCLNL